MNKFELWVVCILLGTGMPLLAQEDDAVHDGDDGNVVEMTAVEREAAGITVGEVAQPASGQIESWLGNNTG